MKPQCRDVLSYIIRHGSIDALQAERHLNCHRLAARISDLKAAGVAIDSTLVTRDGHRWSVYRLAPVTEQLVVGL